METRPDIEYRNLETNPTVERNVTDHVAALEDRFGRITACRVVITGPGGRHRTGGLHHVTIHMQLPGGHEVNVNRQPPQDERYADLTFAIDDAFRHARRRLQDRVRRMQGKVKRHSTPGGAGPA
jgi:ribosome-associated translation inhibitor RaiA